MSGGEKREARDWSVRGLPPPSSQERALAERLGEQVYDGRRAAVDASFQMPATAGLERRVFFLPLRGLGRLPRG